MVFVRAVRRSRFRHLAGCRQHWGTLLDDRDGERDEGHRRALFRRITAAHQWPGLCARHAAHHRDRQGDRRIFPLVLDVCGFGFLRAALGWRHRRLHEPRVRPLARSGGHRGSRHDLPGELREKYRRRRIERHRPAERLQLLRGASRFPRAEQWRLERHRDARSRGRGRLDARGLQDDVWRHVVRRAARRGHRGAYALGEPDAHGK